MTLSTGTGSNCIRTSDRVQEYGKLGFNIVALKPRGKVPAVPKLEPYFERLSTAEERQTWFANGQEHNLGIITGRISGLVVIDVDGDSATTTYHEKLQSIPALYDKALSTLQVKTGKGLHFYFKFDVAEFPAGIDTTQLAKTDGGEVLVRGNHGYVVGAGSTHPSGAIYRANEGIVQTITKPEWNALLDVFGKTEAARTPITDLFKSDYAVSAGNNRHEDLLRTTESLIQRNKGILTEDQTKRLAVEWNDTHCKPPLSESEFQRQWECAKGFIAKHSETDNTPDGMPAGVKVGMESIKLTDDLVRELSFDELATILEITIKKDYEAKVITFAAMLLAQTESDQINIGFQSDSSTGKSYTALELAKYFPHNEILELFNVSPTAFFHDSGRYDKNTNITTVDLEGKILIFIDNPHYTLLTKLRPLLSKDKKEIFSKITDKSKSGSNRTKNIIIRGFFTTIYCSANKKTDEQEQTRLLFLSAASDCEKLRESLTLSCLRESDKEAYEKLVNSDPQRIWLRKRVVAIRQTGIRNVRVPRATVLILERFLGDHPHLIPRLQRDLPRIFDFIKASALLNCFNRLIVGVDCIEATEQDIEQGYLLYKRIEAPNELGLSPAVFEFYETVVIPLLESGHERGINRKELSGRYFKVNHKTITKNNLGDTLDELENRGLIAQEPDPDNKRQLLVAWGIKNNHNVSGGTKSEARNSNTPQYAKINSNITTAAYSGGNNLDTYTGEAEV